MEGQPNSYLLNFCYIYTKILPSKYQPTMVFLSKYTNPTCDLVKLFAACVTCGHLAIGSLSLHRCLPVMAKPSLETESFTLVEQNGRKSGPKKWRKHDSWGCLFIFIDILYTFKEIWWSRIFQMFLLIHKRLMDVILTRTDVPRTKLKYMLIYDFFVNHANLFEIPWPRCCFGLAQLVLAFFLLGIDWLAPASAERNRKFSVIGTRSFHRVSTIQRARRYVQRKRCAISISFKQMSLRENGSPCLIGTYIALKIESRWILSLF